jgi:succinate dehydrogenase / fumarate reductase flavoprotein subunit
VLADGKRVVFPGLYAAGECACFSVHGANRLGTNSLVDLLVFGKRAGADIIRYVAQTEFAKLAVDTEDPVAARIEALLGSTGIECVSEIRTEMQKVMTEQCSVFRDKKNLEQALAKIQQLKAHFANIGLKYKGKAFNYDLEDALELGNMLKLAESIVFSALRREESRGSHYRNDFPLRNDNIWLKHTLVFQNANGLDVQYKPVIITRFEPKARTY